MTSRMATCSCGQLAVECEGEPALVSVCHCRACQKRTGAPFGIAAFFAKRRIRISGRYRDFVRDSDSGHDVAFHFCPECASTVCWEPGRKPDMLAIATGAFADPSFPAPSQDVHAECRHTWIRPLDAWDKPRPG